MEDYIYDEMYKEEATHWWFCAKRKIVLGCLEQNIKGKEKVKILDSGCGCGYILNNLKQYGTVYGMDYSEKAINYSKQHFDGEILKGDLNGEIPYENEFFDVILSLDVLEHIEDDKKALKNLYRILKNDGKVIMTVPAHMSLWSYHDESHMHKRRYSMDELIDKVESCGFKIDYCTYYNMWLFLPIYFVRKINKLFVRQGKKVSDNKEPNKMINGLFYKIFSSEARWIKNKKKLPMGVSIFVVLKKEVI